MAPWSLLIALRSCTINGSTAMRSLLFVSFLLLLSLNLSSQALSLGAGVSLGYYIPDQVPAFGRNGYPDHIYPELSLRAQLQLSKRFLLGVSISQFTRRERFDCIYFPGPEDALRNLGPPINNAQFGCPSSSDTKIYMMDADLLVWYQLLSRPKYEVYFGAGVGPVLLLDRKTTVTDNQSGESQLFPDTEPGLVVWDWFTFRTGLSVARNISPKVKALARLDYRSEGGWFEQNTFSIGLDFLYRIGQLRE